MGLLLGVCHLKELYKNNYTSDIAILLKSFEEGVNIEEMCAENTKLKALYDTIVRKGLISDNKITLLGKELLSFLSTEGEVKLVKKVVKDDGFDRWWTIYPGTDSFEYNNRTFKGTRAMRVKKDDCKTKIKNILNEGEYTIDDLIGALEIEVFQKKENSVKTGQNKLSYMQNSLTYLNQRSFEPFIELYKAGHKEKKEPNYGGVEI